MTFCERISNIKSQIITYIKLIGNWILDIGNWIFSRKARAGFTLVELLVVISIIGVLTAIGFISFTNAADKGRDAHRKADLKAISGALVSYYQDHDAYPPDPTVSDTQFTSDGSAPWIPDLTSNYLQNLPTDPKQAGFNIISNLAQNLRNRFPLPEGRGFLIFAQNLLYPQNKFRGFFAQNKSGTPVILGVASPRTIKVLVLNYNPIIESSGNRKLTAVKGWNDPNTLTQSIVNTFGTVSGGVVNFQIVQTVEMDDIPIKTDGFDYSDDTYLTCAARGGSSCHSPDNANYLAMINAVDACGKRNRGEIDELWIWGGPWFGYWESNLAGPGAFFYNSGPTTGSSCEKLLPIMGLNYERGEAEALESFGHRYEYTMDKVYGGRESQYTHNWNKFTLVDIQLPGKGGCGNAHDAVNANPTGYNRTDPDTVPSSCDDFLNYPNLTGTFTSVNCTAWGCSALGYLKWWYSHVPRYTGVGPDGKLNNWWDYIVDPQGSIINPPAAAAAPPAAPPPVVAVVPPPAAVVIPPPPPAAAVVPPPAAAPPPVVAPPPALAGDCNNKNGVYCYIVSPDRSTFILWAQLDNTKDNEAVGNPGATCNIEPPPGSNPKYNYCLESPK